MDVNVNIMSFSSYLKASKKFWKRANEENNDSENSLQRALDLIARNEYLIIDKFIK